MSERHDPYRGVARHYDLHRMDWYAPTYGKRLLGLLAERGLGGSKVLDAGCGTGTLALMLAREGYRVTGVDLSESLLEVASGKDAAGAVAWKRADITRLDLGETFDVVTTVADVLNHLESLDQWEAAFRGFAAHLRSGGVLFLDVMTCGGLARLDSYTTQDREDGVLILGIVYERAERRSTLKITSFRPVPGAGLWERASQTITEWGQPVAGILDRLGRAGFADPERLWPHAADPEEDERLAVLTRRLGVGP